MGKRRFSISAVLTRVFDGVRMIILEKVWDYDFDPGSNIIDVYVRRLREKIDDGFEPKLIHSVRGVGCVMKEDA